MTDSKTLFEAAKNIFVGGVNSPVRAFKSVGGTPIFFKQGKGAKIISEDDTTLIDYVLSWGPMILGHAHPKVVAAITQAAQNGTSFGAPTQRETTLALLIREAMPSLQKIRFVSSGTEATMSALRLARGVTGRKKIIKFDGCYHGHSDGLLVAAGSGAMTLGTPNSSGVLPEVAEHTLVLPYNDIAAVKQAFETYGSDIAALIVEPVAGNMGLIKPVEGFLETLRERCTANGTLLIFDEVMCGFRVHPGGAQALYSINPDLTCLGKVIGGGLPCGAFGGNADIMAHLSPQGNVYQAGTLSGNPVAMAAGIATLTELNQNGNFDTITKNTRQLVDGLNQVFEHKAYTAHCEGSMWGIFRSKELPRNLNDAKNIDHASFGRLFHDLINHKIYIAPSAYEANFMSVAHTKEDIRTTIEAFKECLESNSLG